MLTQVSRSKGTPGPTSQWPRWCLVDATLDTGRRRAGVDSDEPNAAARLGRGAGFAHRGSAGLWLGAFDAARRRASNGGGRSGWNGRGQALRARRRRGASGEQRQRWYGARSGNPESGARPTCTREQDGREQKTKRSPERRRRRATRRRIRSEHGVGATGLDKARGRGATGPHGRAEHDPELI